jgi:hypothetical protein
MNLYRAVTVPELRDIQAHGGRFRDSIHQTGEKAFFFKQEDAETLARSLTSMTGEDHAVVITQASDEVVAEGRPHRAAQEGPGVYLKIDVLQSLALAKEVIL